MLRIIERVQLSMLAYILNWFEQRRARALRENTLAWHQTFEEITSICGQALLDEAALQGDIGELLDGVDRRLFRFSNYTVDLRRLLRHSHPHLAEEVGRLSQQLITLRNLTTRYLIRAQGQAGSKAHYLALEEFGFQGRELKDQLDAGLRTVWAALQALLQGAHNAL